MISKTLRRFQGEDEFNHFQGRTRLPKASAALRRIATGMPSLNSVTKTYEAN
jgi:hypothetical protein